MSAEIAALLRKAKPKAPHQHRRPKKADFEGKTIKRFVRSADNVWRIWFTDGTGFAIQSEMFYPGIACMELCGACLADRGVTRAAESPDAP